MFKWRDKNRTAYDVLISEILLRRTTAIRVEEIFLELINKYPENKILENANSDELIVIISKLGLKSRYKTLIEAAKYIGQAPRYNYDTLKQINGIGDYIAGAFMIFFKRENFPIVDSNIRRIFFRHFSINSEKKVINLLSKINIENIDDYYYALIDFGALVCTPKPKCFFCPFKKSCKYNES